MPRNAGHFNNGQMKFLILILAVLSLASCKEKHEIEIYLLKERVPNKHGVPVRDIKEFREGLDAHPEEAKNYVFATYDTVTKQMVFADAFDAPPKEKWQDKPFIKDTEILGLNTFDGKIRLSNSGGIKIIALKHDHLRGLQFVVSDNGKPIMTGYFWNMFSSLESNADNILYLCSEDPSKEYYDFEIQRTNWKPSFAKKTNFKNYPELVNAFKESDRLIKQ
jgi:hypothetical protein